MTDRGAPEGPHPTLGHVEAWVFDLDNTLYPHSCNLFEQIDARMKEFICALLGCDTAAAHVVQKDLFRRYGTTMRGLMTEHGVEPNDFLNHVHAIDHSPVPADPHLEAALMRLQGPKYILTNASRHHAERVMDRVGVAHHFEAIFDIVAAGYRPKPDPAIYEGALEAFGITAETAVFFDDIPKNLEPAHALGMTTVWIRTETEYATIGEQGEHIHHQTDNLADWLHGVAAARED